MSQQVIINSAIYKLFISSARYKLIINSAKYKACRKLNSTEPHFKTQLRANLQS